MMFEPLGGIPLAGLPDIAAAVEKARRIYLTERRLGYVTQTHATQRTTVGETDPTQAKGTHKTQKRKADDL